MQFDERDRPDGPGPDSTPDTDETQAVDAIADQAPTPHEATADTPMPDEPVVSSSEIESWPSQDAAPVSEPWPTEPPVAGSAPADAWPTEPPELGAERIPEPAHEPPPSEVEAYAAPPPVAPIEPAAAESLVPPIEPTPAESLVPPIEPIPAEPAIPAVAPIEAQAVPPVESATGESTLCPHCGTENQAGLSFCRNCGQRLVAAGISTTVERPAAPEGTMACPRCGTHNRAGVSFCQNCGANLRGASAGYVPPAAQGETTSAAAPVERGGAVLGPVVLLIGIVGLVTGYLLPFAFGSDSLFERAFGAGGHGISFWTAYPDGGLADQAYFGLAAAVPLLAVLLGILAIAGFVRARPGMLQVAGLVIALLWSIGLIVGFVAVEVGGNWSGDVVRMLGNLTPAGIILFLASLIVVIGGLTRFGRS